MLVEADDTVEADKVLSGREEVLAHSDISGLESKGWLMTAYLAIQRQLGRRSHWSPRRMADLSETSRVNADILRRGLFDGVQEALVLDIAFLRM